MIVKREVATIEKIEVATYSEKELLKLVDDGYIFVGYKPNGNYVFKRIINQ